MTTSKQTKNTISKDISPCQIGAFKYMEVSALTMEGVKELFLEVIKVAVHGQGGDEKKGCCTIL